MGVGTFRRQFRRPHSCFILHNSSFPTSPPGRSFGNLLLAIGDAPERPVARGAGVLACGLQRPVRHPVLRPVLPCVFQLSAFKISAFVIPPSPPAHPVAPSFGFLALSPTPHIFLFDKTNPFSHCENPLNTGLLPNSAPGRQAKTNPFSKDQKSTFPPAPWRRRPRPMPLGFRPPFGRVFGPPKRLKWLRPNVAPTWV